MVQEMRQVVDRSHPESQRCSLEQPLGGGRCVDSEDPRACWAPARHIHQPKSPSCVFLFLH